MYWVLISVKNSSRRRFVKNMFWKISQNSQEHTCVGVFFKQLQACNFIIRKTLTRVFSLKFCEIFTNNFFTEHFRACSMLCLSPKLLKTNQNRKFSFLFIFEIHFILLIADGKRSYYLSTTLKILNLDWFVILRWRFRNAYFEQLRLFGLVWGLDHSPSFLEMKFTKQRKN